ncbi:MAG: argininosuccinate lyase, partial [Fibrobacter sp.]|nr:argininosuccinate lyase [Fibrobacter sp.]
MAKTSAKKSENKAKKGTQTNMWTGRFASGMAQSMVDLSFSLQFDAELIEEDIEGSIGHGKGLVESGVLSKADYKKICDGLASILKDYKAGKNLWQESDEDIHMAVERVLTERIGALGKKIHTGRSRNDQVCTDFKLYMRHRAAEIRALEVSLMETVLDLAKKYFGKMMPGYTHLQQA